MRRLLTLTVAAALLAPTAWAKVTLPRSNEFTLANGMAVCVIERHELPLFSVQLTFRAGSVYDPVGKEGLASLTSDMLMRGTAARNAKKIAEDVAFGGGTLSNSCSYGPAGLDGEFLVTQGEPAFEILSDLVRQSTFTAEEFEKTRTLAVGQIQSRHENPSMVANDAIWEAMLPGSRYGHFTAGSAASVTALTRDDVLGFARARYTPDNALLVVCGDVATDKVREWVERHFGSWQGKAEPVTTDEPFAALKGREVIVYDKTDATQTQIRLGGLGIPLGHADYPALEVARTVYGGSFAARLMNEIRVNRGLSYGVYCRSINLRPGGLVWVTTFTKNATVGEVIDIILAEAARMQTELVSDSELTDRASYRRGTYPLDFETNDDLARVFTSMWLNKLDRSYYEDFQERLAAVKAPLALDAALKYFPQDVYRLVLVGKADEIRPQVEKYGTVKVLPFSEE